jgi:hypothetical protein
MKIQFKQYKSSINHHGTQRKGERWNEETVKGWRLRFIDIRKANDGRMNPTRCKFFLRTILYFPSGAWRHVDLIVSRSI